MADTKHLGLTTNKLAKMVSDLEVENRKLRELIADVHEALCLDKADMFREPIIKSLERDMRELGIEVQV